MLKSTGLRLTWAFCLAFLSFALQPVIAVFQDEAYNVDYAHTLVGTPIRRSTFFHAPSTGSKATLLYTLSEQGVVGAINPRDGELVWRTLANDTISTASKEEAHGVLRAHESSTTVVSGFGNFVRAWDAKDGRLVWQWTSPQTVKSLEVIALGGTQGDIVVMTEGEKSGGNIWRLSGNDGSEKWTTPLAPYDYPVGLSVSPYQLYSTSLSPIPGGGYKVKIQTIDDATGKELFVNILDTHNEITSEKSIVHLSGSGPAPFLVWVDDKIKNIRFNVLGNKQSSISIHDPYGTGQTKSVLVHEPTSVDASPHFLIQFNGAEDHRGEVWHADPGAGKFNRAFAVVQTAGPGSFSAGSNGKDVYFVRHTSSETKLIESKKGDILETWSSSPAKGSEYLNQDAVFSAVELAPQSGSNFAIRNAYVNTDGDWNLAQNGAHTWSRHEGLAGVAAAAFIDVPAEESLVEALAAETDANPAAAYLHRIQRHIADLQHFPQWAANVPARLISSFTGINLGDDASPIVHDSFGFNKIVLVVTKTGRIAALASAAQGQLLWSKQAVFPADGADWRVHSIDISPNGVHIIGYDGEFVIVDPVTGRIIQQQAPIPGSGTSHYVSLTTSNGQLSLIAISDKGVPGNLPEFVPADSVLVTERADGTVAGWKPSANGKTVLAWSFSPKEGETIRSMTTRLPHDPVASIGRALGDRNVLYKYLSGNLILITASSLAASTLSVYLLDSVTGQTLYSASHANVDVSIDSPVTFSENWFAYSLFSDIATEEPIEGASSDSNSNVKAHQLVVSEIFESQIPNDRGPLGEALNFSSYAEFYSPDVKSIAYVVQAPITSLSTTSTLQGITPRSLLAYTPALAALLAIPVPFLSPRRPVNRDPTPAEREEGLPRYQAHLDFSPTWFLSHKRELLGIENVISAPTQMESTSLVFGFGDLDIFGTRISPIGAFDVLGKGFGKIQLVLTCVALAVGTGFLSPMARRKQIDSLWRS